MESRSNKVFLPKHPDSHPSRSVHNGRHLNSVSVNIEDKMNKIYKEGKANDWAQQQYKNAVDKMLVKERVELKAENIN